MNLSFNGFYIIIIFLIYNLIISNYDYIRYVLYLVLNLTPIYFIILANLFLILYVIFKLRINFTINISYN